jgi:hypothetical protein
MSDRDLDIDYDIKIEDSPKALEQVSSITKTQAKIVEVCDRIKEMLLKKNREYGDSAVNPINIFAKGVPSLTQINVRIDDKINRIMQGNKKDDEDVDADLTGYFVLRIVAKELLRG